MTDTLNDWYVIVNPHAGSGKTISEWALAEDRLSELGVPYKAILTTHKYHAMQLAYDAAGLGYRRIIAVGGDGSFHEVLTGLMRYCDDSGTKPSEFYVAVIPIGSGNDWIKQTKVPHDTRRVCELIASESFGLQDVVRVETAKGICYMGNIAGVGFDAHVCERVNSQKEMGRRSELIYVAGLIYTVFHSKAFPVRLEADGELVYEGEMMTLGMGNGSYSGGGMQQVPHADINDGILDWMLVPKQPVLSLIPILPKLFNGTFSETAKALHGRCRELSLSMADCSKDEIVEADGEIVGTLPMKVSVTGEKVNILVGKEGI